MTVKCRLYDSFVTESKVMVDFVSLGYSRNGNAKSATNRQQWE